MEPSREIARLLDIMKALRDPETGCPWDVEQNFSSIVPYTIEEAYEVADAIERNDMEELRLELGDLLLQSVYHAQMASEAGHFDFGDVVEGITAKMIRRHPHVFGTEDVSAAQYSARGMENSTWERIKAEEKAEAEARRAAMGLPSQDESKSILDEIPVTLPGMVAAVKLQKKAAKVGLDWGDPRPVIDKIREEIDEFEEALVSGDEDDQAGELGDMLFALVNLARKLGIDPEAALRKTNRKFRRRFAFIENALGNDREKLEASGLDEMDRLWKEAKAAE